MEQTFQLVIKTPDREVFSGAAVAVNLTSELGEMQILPRHADLMTTIGYTKVNVETTDGRSEFVGRRGMFVFHNFDNRGELLLLDCQLRRELSRVSAEEYLQYVMAQLDKGADLTKSQIKFMQEEQYMLERLIQDVE
jgi:F-type H+-transporting ATPase subunit epsilon